MRLKLKLMHSTSLSTSHEARYVPELIRNLARLFGHSTKVIGEHQGQLVLCSSHEEAFQRLCNP